ncbi:MAG: LysR substrate-binding domain-containing protein [Desulfovibrio sp.]
METRQLKYFIAVAEELHFGNAAKRLHMSQPPLSQQIIKFEEELGVTLFKRNKRSVKLTAAGKSLLGDARNILSKIELARENIADTVCGNKGQVSMGYIGPALNTTLPYIISKFKTTYPSVKFTMNQMGTNTQLEAIRSETLDAGVVRLFRHNIDGLDTTLFHREAYAVVVPDGHRFESRHSVDICELAEERLIFFPRKSHPPLYDEWMKLFAECGFSPRLEQEVETKSAALALTTAKMGISIVPESMRAEARGGVNFIPLTGGYPPLEFHFITRKKGMFPTTNNLRELFRAQKKDLRAQA